SPGGSLRRRRSRRGGAPPAGPAWPAGSSTSRSGVQFEARPATGGSRRSAATRCRRVWTGRSRHRTLSAVRDPMGATVYIVEDHAEMRSMLADYLSLQIGIETVGAAASAEE